MGATETDVYIQISSYKDIFFEDVVSRNVLSKFYEKLSGQKISEDEITTLTFHGDKSAIAACEAFGKAAADAPTRSIKLIDPDTVIIGGSIANSMKLFLPSLEESLRKDICSVPVHNPYVLRTQWVDYVGFSGAVALVYT